MNWTAVIASLDRSMSVMKALADLAKAEDCIEVHAHYHQNVQLLIALKGALQSGLSTPATPSEPREGEKA